MIRMTFKIGNGEVRSIFEIFFNPTCLKFACRLIMLKILKQKFERKRPGLVRVVESENKIFSSVEPKALRGNKYVLFYCNAFMSGEYKGIKRP